MLADFGACCGGHEHGASRDVEGVRTIATGAHNVHQVRGISHLDLGGELAHDLCGRCDFTDGFFFHAQAGHECGQQHGRHFARHDLAHEVQHLVVKNFAVLDGALQCFLRRDGHSVGHGARSWGISAVE